MNEGSVNITLQYETFRVISNRWVPPPRPRFAYRRGPRALVLGAFENDSDVYISAGQQTLPADSPFRGRFNGYSIPIGPRKMKSKNINSQIPLVVIRQQGALLLCSSGGPPVNNACRSNALLPWTRSQPGVIGAEPHPSYETWDCEREREGVEHACHIYPCSSERKGR
jgi:hypothetical protein